MNDRDRACLLDIVKAAELSQRCSSQRCSSQRCRVRYFVNAPYY